jgi:hypothetical protein
MPLNISVLFWSISLNISHKFVAFLFLFPIFFTKGLRRHHQFWSCSCFLRPSFAYYSLGMHSHLQGWNANFSYILVLRKPIMKSNIFISMSIFVILLLHNTNDIQIAKYDLAEFREYNLLFIGLQCIELLL